MIGALQGLMNSAGLSFMDKLKINKYLKKAEEGTATITECNKVFDNLRSGNTGVQKIDSICKVYIAKNQHLLFAYTNLGVLSVQQILLNNRDDYRNKTEFQEGKAYLESALNLVEDPITLNSLQKDGDLFTLMDTQALMNYYYGFIMYIENNKDKSESFKKLGIKQIPKLKNHLPY